MAKQPAARWERCRDFVVALESAMSPTVVPAEKTIAVEPPPLQAPRNAPVARRARAATDLTEVMAADTAAGPIRGPDPALPYPVIKWGGFAVPGVTKSRRSRRPALLATAVVLIVLLVATAAYLVTLPPAVTLSSYVVRAGDRITVTATNLPPYQDAQVELLSDLVIFPFRADAIGRATRDVDIPTGTDGGDHTIRICWGSDCPLSTTLFVQATFLLTGPSPSPARSP